MRRIFTVLLALTIGSFWGALNAHEGKHVMGTITAADSGHIEVKTDDGKAVTVKLDSHTKYFKGKDPATAIDMKVGLRVVLHLQRDAKEAIAVEVHLPAQQKDSGKDAHASGPGSSSVHYTCPMHPDVLQDAPGKCPKCGMTLVPKK